MNSIDLTPLYRSSIGFDQLASLLDNALTTDSSVSSHPPYNIEICEDNRYAITLAVAGFELDELDINVEKGVLSVSGKKDGSIEREFLHQGISNRAFERKFNLADYVEVMGADLNNGLLSINLVREIPESMKPKNIQINQGNKVLEHKTAIKSSNKQSKVA